MKTIIKYCLCLVAMLMPEIIFSQELSEKQYAPFNLPFLDYISSYDFADFNKDNRNDVVVVTTSGNQLLLAIKINEGDSLQNSLGKIDSIYDYILKVKEIQNPAFIVASDIDGDGDSDLYVGEVAGSILDAKVGIIENKSFGDELLFKYRSVEQFKDMFVLAVPSVVDLDKDGKEDLIVSDFKGQLNYYKNNSSFQFTELEISPFDEHRFTSSVSFAEIQSENKVGLLAYTYEEDFQFFSENTNENGTYVFDPNAKIIKNPDSLRTKFYQTRFTDVDNDENPDLFLSALTFGDNRGYYTDSWLFPSKAFGAITTIEPAGCIDIDGQINFNMRNGTPPYSYKWVNTDMQEGSGIFINEKEKLIDLLASNYMVTVTDANGKSISKEVVLSQAERIRIRKVIDGPSCPSDPTGKVILTPIEGKDSLTYLWEDGSTENGLSGVIAGDYNVTISDANNCQLIETIRLEDPNALRNSFRVNNCGDGEVIIVASVENGQLPYTYNWNSGEIGKLLSNKEAGIYTVTITDATGCQKVDSVTIENIEPLMVEFEVNDISCSGANDGSIVVNTLGGTEDMIYEWNGRESEKDIRNLSAGSYFLNVRFNGCSQSFTRTVQEPLPLFVNVRQIVKEDGFWQVFLEIEGGANPYKINWSNGANGLVLEQQDFGTTLSFSIEDENGCNYSDNIQIGTVGISDELTDLLGFNIFPNPTNNQLNVLVDFPSRVNAFIEIFDVVGRKVDRKFFDTANISTSFDVRNFTSGTYILKISSNEKIASKKFIVH